MKSTIQCDSNVPFHKGKLYIRKSDDLIVLCTKRGSKLEGTVIHFYREVGKHQKSYPGTFIPFIGTITLSEN